jgi:hypothetical protein
MLVDIPTEASWVVAQTVGLWVWLDAFDLGLDGPKRYGPVC